MADAPPRVCLYTALDQGCTDASIMERIRAVQAVATIPDPFLVLPTPVREAKVRADTAPRLAVGPAAPGRDPWAWASCRPSWLQVTEEPPQA